MVDRFPYRKPKLIMDLQSTKDNLFAHCYEDILDKFVEKTNSFTVPIWKQRIMHFSRLKNWATL